jgi:hypothetical protein
MSTNCPLSTKYVVNYSNLEVSHPPYTPKLVCLDFLLFLKLKAQLKGKFVSKEGVTEILMRKLEAIPREVL